ncbi:hypothetical protein X925_09015 [Petrotoga sp. 9T1HF07.CasAA.8.2]|nr:hypothetical protein X925_09015 [Petrotoga sp. 9T1HF07.CasAA.8.2]
MKELLHKAAKLFLKGRIDTFGNYEVEEVYLSFYSLKVG